MSDVMQIDVNLQDGYLPLDVSLETGNVLDITFDAQAGGRLPYYDGDYSVSPRLEQQTLHTKNKSMHDDVIIDPIFYSEVSNPEGGETIYIGIV